MNDYIWLQWMIMCGSGWLHVVINCMKWWFVLNIWMIHMRDNYMNGLNDN